MLPTEFVLFFYHHALRYLNSQKKLNARHAKWVEFLNEYSFVINHRTSIENKVVDALSRLTITLHRMSAHVIGFDRLKDEYSTCKTRENSNFLKKGKMVISVKIRNFPRSRMTKRTSSLESSCEI